VLNNPAAYFIHRWDIFKKMLRFDPQNRSLKYWIDWNSGFKHQNMLGEWIHTNLNSNIFKPWIYLLLLILQLPLCLFVREKYKSIFLTINLTAIIYELAYFIFSPATDLRFSIWIVPISLILPFFYLENIFSLKSWSFHFPLKSPE